MKKKESIYSTSQATLYTVCENAWKQCSEYLPQFTAFKTNYTEDYIAAALKDVDTARLMPKARQNTSERKDARTALIEATKVILSDWQQLKLYITSSFDKPFIATKLDQAGAEYYNASSSDHWNGLKNLIETASDFLTNNTDILVNQGKMPIDFPATFTADAATCTSLYDAFFQANVDKQKGTGEKIKANNAIYSTLISMLKDGAHIFDKDAVLKKMFTFSHLVSMTNGEGSASISGYVYHAGRQPLQGVVISIKNQEKAATTSKKGHFRLTRLTEGTYTLVATLPGYGPVEQQITLSKGTRSTITFELTNIMKKVA